jgi:flagellar biosynthesis component FlhA
MENDKQRLVELLQEANREAWNLINMSCCEERLKLLDKVNEIRADHLLEHGVIVPPCKVGDKVWTKYGYTFEVEGIEILKDKKIFRCGNLGTDDYMAFFEDEIGKDVFFAKEEAEKALNNIRNGNSCEGGAQG